MGSSLILVANDEKHMRLALTVILTRAGYKVMSAENGLIALDSIMRLSHRPEPVELLLTDIRMPHLTGLELIYKLAEHRISLPVIVMTDYGDEELKNRLQHMGVTGYIDKPFNAKQLINIIADVLRRT